DRFLLKSLVASPTVEEIGTILDRTTAEPASPPTSVLNAERVVEMQNLTRQVPLGERAREWIARLVHATRPDTTSAVPLARRFVRYGASARAAQALALCGKVLSLAEGRAAVSRDDLGRIAHAALRHRIVLNFEGEAEGVTPEAVVNEALDAVKGV
ncbi:MAG: AAA family ATPase, partial [Planctomycetota bacterium]